MQHQNPNGIHNVLTIIADVSKQSSHCSSVPSSDQSSLVQSVELASSPIFCVCRNRLFISWTRRSSFVSHFKGKYINHSVIQQQGVKKKQSYFFKWSRTESESWTQLDSWYVDLLYKKKKKRRARRNLYCPTYYWQTVSQNQRNRKFNLLGIRKDVSKKLSNGAKRPCMHINQLTFHQLRITLSLSKTRCFLSDLQQLTKTWWEMSNIHFAWALCMRSVSLMSLFYMLKSVFWTLMEIQAKLLQLDWTLNHFFPYLPQNQSFLAWRVMLYQQAYSPFFFLPGHWFRNGTRRPQAKSSPARFE